MNIYQEEILIPGDGQGDWIKVGSGKWWMGKCREGKRNLSRLCFFAGCRSKSQGAQGLAELLRKRDEECEMGVENLSGGNCVAEKIRSGLGQGTGQWDWAAMLSLSVLLPSSWAEIFPSHSALSHKGSQKLLCGVTGTLASMLPARARPAGLPKRAWGWLGCAFLQPACPVPGPQASRAGGKAPVRRGQGSHSLHQMPGLGPA